MRLDQYEVVRELGRGGMGVVLEVRDPALPDRRLALKRILPGLVDAEGLRRLRGEAEALAQVRHPGVVVVHAYVEPGPATGANVPYVVTDLVEGEDLARHVKAHGLPGPARAAALARDLADALAATHAAGVLHRDLKPSNVLVRPDGAPVIIDFGLALQHGATRLTATGAIAGTPGFLAPEQAGLSASQDARVDVWAAGALLFWLLTGRAPFEGPVVQLLYALLHDEPPTPSALAPGVPPGLDAIARRALARDPAERFASAGALRDALSAWLATAEVGAEAPRRPGPLLVAAAVVAGSGLLAAAVAWAARPVRSPAADPAPVAPMTSVASSEPAPIARGLPAETPDDAVTGRRRAWRAARVLRGEAAARGATAQFLPGGALVVSGETGARLYRLGAGSAPELVLLEELPVDGGCVAVTPAGDDGLLLLAPDAVLERAGPGRVERVWPRPGDAALPGSAPLAHLAACGEGVVVVAREGQPPALVRGAGRGAGRGAATVTPLPSEGRLRALLVHDGRLLALGAREQDGLEVSGALCAFRLPDLTPAPGSATSHAPTCLAAERGGDRRLVLGTADGRLNLLTPGVTGWGVNITPPLEGAPRLRGVAYGDGQVFALEERRLWRVPLQAVGVDDVGVHTDLGQDVALRAAASSLSLSFDQAVLAVCSEGGDVVLIGTRAAR